MNYLCFPFLLQFLLFYSSIGIEGSDVELKLIEARKQINSNTDPFCYNTHSGSKHAAHKNDYGKYTNDLNAWVYPFCLTTHEVGNRLGNYFTELGCAEVSGFHFLSIHPQWEMKGSINANSTFNESISREVISTFLKNLPSVIVHPDPKPREEALKIADHSCKCSRYCWQHVNAPWVKAIPSIQKAMRHALTAYLDAVRQHAVTHTTINPVDDLTNVPIANRDSLPLIPDAAIQYRCGDNIAFSYMYGILPFSVFDQRIPRNAKYIYVLSDHPSRAMHSPYTIRCQVILKSLMDYLTERYPRAQIVVKRGGDLFLDMARFAFANVTICSASTYCFWPALSNTEGTVHFPITSLIAGADELSLAPNFTTNFHWIAEPKIISNFKPYRPWTAVIDVLTGKVDPPK